MPVSLHLPFVAPCDAIDARSGANTLSGIRDMIVGKRSAIFAVQRTGFSWSTVELRVKLAMCAAGSGEVVYASRMRCLEGNIAHREAGYLIEVHGCRVGVNASLRP